MSTTIDLSKITAIKVIENAGTSSEKSTYITVLKDSNGKVWWTNGNKFDCPFTAVEAYMVPIDETNGGKLGVRFKRGDTSPDEGMEFTYTFQILNTNYTDKTSKVHSAGNLGYITDVEVVGGTSYQVQSASVKENALYKAKTSFASSARPSNVLGVAVTVPTPSKTAYPYDGSAHTPVSANTTYYKRDGDYTATAAGAYTLVLTIAEKYQYWDKTTPTRDNQRIPWTIGTGIDYPDGTSSFNYDAEAHQPIAANPTYYSRTDDYEKTAIGSYSCTVTPKAGYYWKDTGNGKPYKYPWGIVAVCPFITVGPYMTSSGKLGIRFAVDKNGSNNPSEGTKFSITCKILNTTHKDSALAVNSNGNLGYVTTVNVTGGTKYTVQAASVSATDVYAGKTFSGTELLSAVLGTKITVPAFTSSQLAKSYTGSKRTITSSTDDYTASGNAYTNAGKYTLTLSLKEQYMYWDKTSDVRKDLTYTWTIGTGIAYPSYKSAFNNTAGAAPYNGTEQAAIAAGDHYSRTSNSTYQYKATDAGDYSGQLTLDDGYYWTDTGDNEPYVYAWTITKAATPFKDMELMVDSSTNKLYIRINSVDNAKSYTGYNSFKYAFDVRTYSSANWSSTYRTRNGRHSNKITVEESEGKRATQRSSMNLLIDTGLTLKNDESYGCIESCHIYSNANVYGISANTLGVWYSQKKNMKTVN